MFVRKKFDADRDRWRVQIVQSYRDGKKVRQKIIRHVGSADSAAQLTRLMELGEVIKEEITQQSNPQQELFTPKQYGDLLSQCRRGRTASRLGVDVGQCREHNRLSVGVREAFGQLYSNLGWDRLLGARRDSANRIIKELVLARITQPRSKRGTVMDLARDGGVTLNLDWVYQSMDYLDQRVIERICRSVAARAEDLFTQPIEVLFYDTTTLYFESDREDFDRKDGLRFKGYSKDGKPNRTQVVLALLVTREGIPLDYELFPGNTYEGHTLCKALDGIAERYDVSRVTVVADAGLFSSDNLEWLRERNLPYIVGFRAKNASRKLKERILDADGYEGYICDEPQELEYRYKTLAHGEESIIVTHSEKRARKDRHNRERALGKLLKRLEKNAQPASLVSRGHARFLNIPSDGKATVNEDKVAEAARWDGIHTIIAWGNDGLSATELLHQYRQLWHIERGFRTNKHDLRIRPIFHWSTRRIRAHIAICYMAFCCVQYMSHRLKALGHPMSPEAIRRELNHLQVSILAHQQDGRRFAMPSSASPEARRIYRCVNLKWNSSPFEIMPM